MRTVEEYIEHIKTLDEKYHWPIENYEKRKSERQEIHKDFPYVITYEGYYPNHDDLEDWCRQKFGDAHGECHWQKCEMGFHYWYEKSGMEDELEDLLYNEITRPEEDTPEYDLWDEYHDLVIDAHFDVIENDLIDRPGNHCHRGIWRPFFIVKTGYDYGFQDFCFKNAEDAVYFKLIWDEKASK